MATSRSKTHIALLRGINVGGKKMVPMKTLAGCLESLGYEKIRTYIQSGNVVFEASKKLTAKSGPAIAAAIDEACGVCPEVLLLTVKELQAAIDGNPFPGADAEPKTLHVYFLASEPKAPNHEALNKVRLTTEQIHLAGKAFYLYTPDGFGVSKLAASAEKHLGVSATARNWRTVKTLWAMATAAEET